MQRIIPIAHQILASAIDINQFMIKGIDYLNQKQE